jgi:3-phosphoshikimate 1-carboxyvinyltransferase
MNRLHLKHYTGEIDQKIQITGSKSESNRLLILQQLYPNLAVDNLSNSDDTHLVQKALANTGAEINIGHAGTAMRFLTGYLATKEGADVILTGSGRMKERPIQILVDALKTLGALLRSKLRGPNCEEVLFASMEMSAANTSLLCC